MSSNRNLLIIVGLLAVVALVLAGVIGFFLFFSSPAPTPPPVEADNSWEQIQSAGKIVVGTSADYPPFTSFTDDFQLEGFDIALMNEIAQRLGVQPEFQNFAFDGLGNALLLDQIDVAIAAISVTPDRAALLGFSNIYLVTEDAFLTTDQAGLSISQAQDLAGRRVGVQAGSVQEQWAQTHLLDTGIIPVSNLLIYQEANAAVADLQAGRLDVVILDLPPAEVAVQAGGLVIAGRGLNTQSLAIALPKGAVSLKAEIDRVLGELQSEGRVAALAQQYLDLEPGEISPTPTATADAGGSVPTPTPVPCLDGLGFVEHLNFDDQGMSAPPDMQPGQPFTKGWRVRNNGTCTWTTDYQLVFAQGNTPAARMGGEPVAVTRDVAPGEVYEIQVNLIAPLQPGLYQGFWQMLNSQDVAFGARLPVGIRVPGAPTATPAPTQTPSPGINFTVDRTNIRQGECVVFSWQTENVREVYFYAQGQNWQDYPEAGVGSRRECPTVNTTYELRVVKQDGSVEIRQITIFVEPVVGAPLIQRFTVDPEPQITVGQCVTIRWNVTGDINTVRLTSNNSSLWDGAPAQGSQQDCPPGQGTIEYGIEANGPGGASRQQRTIRVVGAATATPAPTPEPDAPVIYAFDVSPNQVEVGGCVNISWRTGGGTSRVQISRDGNVTLDNAPIEGSVQDCNLTAAGTVIFRIDAANSAGQAIFQEDTVNVSEAPPNNPLAGTAWILQDGVPGTSVTISFGADGTVNGSSGCNSYSAQYLVTGQNLAITAPVGTNVFCAEPEGIMEQEAQFLADLPTAGSYEINRNGAELSIFDTGGTLMMTFSRM
ncbi:MAG TPA: transporter substrate-binding domain-containing protein [Anaerolineae bacterium]|nr:transporter substrate-binding domain-containing protein [Anaerolineae bacterium]MCB9105027.1 transporter substrate-binding domain-containing protein [Anaerolineales bacterium]HRV92946.1 transporter substrate-binding domain-containing protein [Anaerolineae bacterium]